MESGYSGTPLVKKLGLKPGMRINLVNAPDSYLEALASTLSDTVQDKPGPWDFAHLFASAKADIVHTLPELKNGLAYTGQLWISWPKGSSGVASDLNENAIRDLGLEAGLVDVKVIAIDPVWSGLKFVYRLLDRPVVNS